MAESATILSELNRIGRCETKPKLHPDDMEIGKKYPMCDIKKIKGKFGDCVIVELDEHVVFLPKRMSDNLTDEMIETLSNEIITLALVYLGEKDTGKSKKAHTFEIIKVKKIIIIIIIS